MLILVPVVQQTSAQQSADPDRYKIYYFYDFVKTRSVNATTCDTIPNLVANHWAQAAKQSIQLGAASLLSLQLTCTDSMYAVVYVDELIGRVWTNILQDSILTDTSYTQEFAVRSTTVEKTTKLGGQFRCRIAFPDWHTQAYIGYYTATWLWKP